jgi:hypothetical protein
MDGRNMCIVATNLEGYMSSEEVGAATFGHLMGLIYKCDFCESTSISEPAVELNGITGTSGGILLPEQFHKKIFCTRSCFWSWVEIYKPDKEE